MFFINLEHIKYYRRNFMKNIKKLAIFIFIIILFFCNTSFASNDEINAYSPACILMESSTGKVLYEKNSNEVRYPASTTKIMTAILTLENCNLTDIATVSYDAVFSVPVGYSHANLQV